MGIGGTRGRAAYEIRKGTLRMKETKTPVVPVEFYRDKKRDWRWRIRATNRKILADSGEGYRRRADAVRGLDRVRKILAG